VQGFDMLNKRFFYTKKAAGLMNQTPTMNTISYEIKGGLDKSSPYIH
jgi:hypothetical protein